MSVKAFNDFLGGINIQKYREKYSRIKLVELDLPKNIQAIRALYDQYWDNQSGCYPSYEEFYGTYSAQICRTLEEFRVETMFSKETFYRGLPARIYRTWASLLTQIQGGYAAAELYGINNVKMSAELDYSGIDMRIILKDEKEPLNIQIKKETLSREVRAPWHFQSRKKEKIVMVTYEVPGCDPLTKTGKKSVPYGRWEAKWEGRLERLPNGFIIFTPKMFEMDNLATP